MIERNRNISSVISLSAGYLLLRLAITDGLFTTITVRLFNNISDLIFYLLTFLLPVPALILFWYLKKPGYFLTLLCTAYIIGSNLLVIFREMALPGRGSLMNELFLILPCVLYGYILYLLLGTDLRNRFNVNRLNVFLVIAFGLSLLICQF